MRSWLQTILKRWLQSQWKGQVPRLIWIRLCKSVRPLRRSGLCQRKEIICRSQLRLVGMAGAKVVSVLISNLRTSKTYIIPVGRKVSNRLKPWLWPKWKKKLDRLYKTQSLIAQLILSQSSKILPKDLSNPQFNTKIGISTTGPKNITDLKVEPFSETQCGQGLTLPLILEEWVEPRQK